ncbi:MAG TPA: hypothetical protein VII13_00930 [Vicinamibacteria bacterium]
MGTGAKIAIGCALALVLAMVVTVLGLGGLAFWAKGKVQEVTGEQERIADLQKQANRNDFERPQDGVIAEDRLLKFLDVRKRVYEVYKKYEPQIEARKNKPQGDVSDVRTAFAMINDIRLAQAQAQADLGVSDEEYRFLVEQVYKTMWAAEMTKATGTASVSEAVGQAYDKAAREMGRAAEAAKQAEARAEREGDRSAEEASEEAQEQVAQGREELEKAGREARDRAREMDVPAANVALFRKYESDIKRYAMSGLEWIGL